MHALPVLAAGAVLATAACGSSPITAAALQTSLAGTFAQLYVLQQRQQSHPPPTLTDLSATAGCQKGTAATAQSGAGNDWVCQVTFFVAGPGTPVHALYNVDVHPDGCWSADGDGPVSVNGARTILDPAGAAHPNPLYLVDGCLDAG